MEKLNFELKELDGGTFLVDYENMVAYEIWTNEEVLFSEKLNKGDYGNLIEQLSFN